MGHAKAWLTAEGVQLQPLSRPDHGELDLAEALPADQPGPAERVEREELFAEQMRTLSTLKRDERRALGLLALGLSYMEICEATGWTYTKVNRCLSEGRAALRELQSDA
jgi:DNA-directed RNA polymerase specialized sigma24 family protein